MSEVSKSLMRTFHSLIDHGVDGLIDCLETRKHESALDDFTDEDNRILETISLTNEQLGVVRKLAREAGKLTVFGILCVIDGVSYANMEIPDLALVNRETKEDIAEKFLHDEFVEQTAD